MCVWTRVRCPLLEATGLARTYQLKQESFLAIRKLISVNTHVFKLEGSDQQKVVAFDLQLPRHVSLSTHTHTEEMFVASKVLTHTVLGALQSEAGETSDAYRRALATPMPQ